MITDIVVNVGDIVAISCSGVYTYHRMITKHPDGGGEFLTVLRDGTRHPQAGHPATITYEELTNPKGYYVEIYERAKD